MDRIRFPKMSSLLKKYLMALSGLALILFVVGHLLGNLQIFQSPQAMNQYAYLIHQVLPTPLLWLFRIGLLFVVMTHVAIAALLKWENQMARPKQYQVERWIQASSASRYMAWSGIVLLTYILFHIMHFTQQMVYPEFQLLEYQLGDQTVPDIYGMMIYGFSSEFWYISLFYIMAQGLLGWHLSHGASSIFQTLGLRNERVRYPLHRLAWGLGILLFLGFASIPTAVLLSEETNLELVYSQQVLRQIESWDRESAIALDYPD